MKILVADKLSPAAVSALEALGAVVTVDADLSADALPGAIADAEVLIVRSTKVNADTIEAGGSLSLIIRAGAGVNTIDLQAASTRGIHVANCPGKNTDAVAELAIGLLIAADRNIVDAACDLRDGKWRKKKYQKAHGLKGRTLGIVGLGAIGAAVAKRGMGLQMNVAAWSRSLTPEKAAQLGVTYYDCPLKLAAEADAISLHLAAKPETKHFVGAEFLAAMKDGAILVNCARGEVVDTAAVTDAVSSKGLRFAADVYEDEPAAGEADFADTALAAAITCTPHIGASTDQAAEAVAEAVVEIVQAYVSSGKPINSVNTQSSSSAERSLVVRHYNHVGVLAGVLDALREGGINIEEMENMIFQGGQAASCTLKLDADVPAGLLSKIRALSDVIHAGLK